MLQYIPHVYVSRAVSKNQVMQTTLCDSRCLSSIANSSSASLAMPWHVLSIAWHGMVWHGMSYTVHAMSCHVMSTSCPIMSRHAMLWIGHPMPCHAMDRTCHVMPYSCHVIYYQVMSCHGMPCTIYMMYCPAGVFLLRNKKNRYPNIEVSQHSRL